MRKLLLALFFVAGTNAAWAQSGEAFFSAGESILSNAGLGSASPTGSPNDYQLDDGFRFGFRFGFNSAGHLGHEFQYAYSRTHLFFQGADLGGMAIHQGGYNFLYYANKDGARIRPFATGGVHFSNFVPPGSSATSGGGSTKFGLNYGAGVKIILTSLFAIRFDIRRYETTKPFDLLMNDGWLHQTEVSAGFGIHF
jgi:hypothetical protein